MHAFALLWILSMLQAGDPDSLLMSYGEYARLRHPVPYVLAVQTKQGGLCYFGAKHTHDLEHSQFEHLVKQWRMFHPTVAFIEGGIPPGSPTMAEAVLAFGEAGLVRYLADRDGVPVQSLEPPLRDAAAHLSTMYTPEQVKVFSALRQVGQHAMSNRPRDLERELQGVLRMLSAVPGLECPPRNLRELEESCQHHLGTEHWQQVPQEWFSPVYETPPTYLNEITRASSRFRDAHMVGLIADAIARDQRVFAVVGVTHVIMQERALRARLAAP